MSDSDDADRGASAVIWLELVEDVFEIHRVALDAVEHATGVAPGWLRVLMLLHEAPQTRLPMSALSTALAMTSGGFTKLADRVERAGLIVRVPSALDRRVIFAELTPHGRASAQRAREVVNERLRGNVLSEFSALELAELHSRLRRVRDQTGSPATAS
jgi:DNA-binding MarR family transcriptional regulator